MQAIFPRKQIRVVAPDPTRRIMCSLLICIGAVFVLATVLNILLPEPPQDVFLWQPLLLVDGQLSILITLVVFALAAVCYFPFTTRSLSRLKQWKSLESNRQRIATAALEGSLPVEFPLPVVVGPLPSTLSIQMRRDWRGTGIFGMVLALLWGLLFVYFFYGPLTNLHFFIQQRQNGWIVLRIIFNVALYSLLSFPTLLQIILAPRQQLFATQDGLLCRCGLSIRSIPWHESRLFSVIAEERGILVYELASRASLIRWSSTLIKDHFPFATVGSAPVGLVQAYPSEDEHRQLIHILTVLIAEKTGLPLVDLRQFTNKQILTDPADYMP